MKPNEKEMKAIRQFMSTDEARSCLNTVWEYESEGGCTHMATDGHTLVLRRAGTHVTMTLNDISKTMTPKALDNAEPKPPAWWSVLKCPDCEGPNLDKRGINPAYFARVAVVENVAERRTLADYVPKAGTSKKNAQIEARRLIKVSEWSIGCNSLDGWYWRIGGNILWEGIIMPRRV